MVVTAVNAEANRIMRGGKFGFFLAVWVDTNYIFETNKPLFEILLR